MQAKLIYHPLHFKVPGGTSRGILKQKDSWFLLLRNHDKIGVGECSIIEGLSVESNAQLSEHFSSIGIDKDFIEFKAEYFYTPALKFALEMAQLDLKSSEPFKLGDNSFYKGEPVAINGLVWMGEKQFMLDQIKAKIESEYNCIKIKIAALDFDTELSLLKYIRNEYSASDIEIRVDANGGFSSEEALEKLKRLSEYSIHSIEQPLKPNQWDAMRTLCEKTPIPIALDEELIGIKSKAEKTQIINSIQPQYIILKPSLIGGLEESNEWIEICESNNIEWWATSALESNIGLNAIAQWVSEYSLELPQGLGTGKLFTNNISSPLEIENAKLVYTSGHWSFPYV